LTTISRNIGGLYKLLKNMQGLGAHSIITYDVKLYPSSSESWK